MKQQVHKPSPASVGLSLQASVFSVRFNRGWWREHLCCERTLAYCLAKVSAVRAKCSLLCHAGMDYTLAAETVYRDLCSAVQDVQSWVKYMRVDGSSDSEYRIVTLRYVQEGLLSADLEQQAAFGDDLALECLATEYQRDIYVVGRTFNFLTLPVKDSLFVYNFFWVMPKGIKYVHGAFHTGQLACLSV